MAGCASVPGILVLAAASVLLLLATFSTPSIKSIYYLEAIIGGTGSAAGRRLTFGTLGYCSDSRCSPLKLGYAITDVNQLFGNDVIPDQYASALVKGLTYTLILQPLAAIISLIALAFALLTFCPGCGCGACCGSFFTGLAASVTLLAFCLDLALFVIAKKRINAIDGASATLGNGLWIVAAAWGCLVIGSIMVCVGACCGGCGGSGGGSGGHRRKDNFSSGHQNPYAGGAPANNNYNNQMRMDALAAERDRKTRQAAYDRGRADGQLPQFAEYVTEHEVPLKDDYDPRDPYQQPHYSQQYSQQYVQAYSMGPHQGYYDQQPQPHHRQQSSTAGYPSTYVPGVGPGYGEGRGGGLAAPVGHGAGSAYAVSPGPSDAAQEFYTPGEGPQPFREGSYTGGTPSGYEPGAFAGAGAAAGAGAGYIAGRGAHGQSTSQHTQSFHPNDHSGYTGAGGHGQDGTSYYTDAGMPMPGGFANAPSPGPGNEYFHGAAPAFPPSSSSAGPARELPDLPQAGGGAGAAPIMSEKERLKAHFAAQDAGGPGAQQQQQQYGSGTGLLPPPPASSSSSGGAQPHAAAVAHLENYADRMGGAGGGAGPSVVSPGGYSYHESQQQQEQPYQPGQYAHSQQQQQQQGGYGYSQSHVGGSGSAETGPPGYSPVEGYGYGGQQQQQQYHH
ncbi:hypothetical protein V8E36_007207 [Tilletia maclaganii]